MTTKHGDRPVLKAVRGPPYLAAYLSFALSHNFFVVHPCIVDLANHLCSLVGFENLEAIKSVFLGLFPNYWRLVLLL